MDNYEPTLLELAEMAYEDPRHVYCEVCHESMEWAEAGVVRYSHAGAWMLAMDSWLRRHRDHWESCQIKKGSLPK